MKKSLRDIDIRYVFALRQLGYGPAAIANEFGVQFPVIKQILDRNTYRSISIEEELLTNWPILSSAHHGEEHGMWKGGVKSHPIYETWKSINQRVNNPRNPRWIAYGGRGISLFSEWTGDMGSRNFLAWIDENLGERPEGWSLDRIDNDGNYEPGNLRWASSETQRLNTRSAMGCRILPELRKIAEKAKFEGKYLDPDVILSLLFDVRDN